jgi:hypothetical protein
MKIMQDTSEKVRIQLPHKTVEINHHFVAGAVEIGNELMPFAISFFQDGSQVSALISCGNDRYRSRWVDYRSGELIVTHLSQVNVPEAIKSLLTSRLDQFLASVQEQMGAAGQVPAELAQQEKKSSSKTIVDWFLGGDR